MKQVFYYLLPALLLAACQHKNVTETGRITQKMPPPRYMPIKTTYRFLASKDSIKNYKNYFPNGQQAILAAVNRADGEHIAAMDSILVPIDMGGNIVQYSPFPQQVPMLQQVRKVIFFSYPAQYFGAYEHGQLVYSGPTNMGREKDKTPTGLFYTNWKATETRSTFNDEWELKWNFNIENKEGVGWHQYAMPGYPASHSCLRLLEEDAKYLFTWADTWELEGDKIVKYGTPVIVFGAYPFGGAKPWWQLVRDAQAMNITQQVLAEEVGRYLNDIYGKQQLRED